MSDQTILKDDAKYIIDGRKTFFIVPDVSLLPESYLEDYLSQGYETYIIGDDRYCPLQKKIEIIISTFKDSILFFYIDSAIPGIDWNVYIKQLQATYGDKILIGVLYAKRQRENDKQNLEKYFLYNVGISCGCIALEYQKGKNFELISKVMYANQASGRRKNVRAICDDSSKINFDFNGSMYRGKLSDVSMSHFSVILDKTHTYSEIPLYEKIKNMFLEINGIHFRTDAVLFIKRPIEHDELYIFIFTKSDGSNGLEKETEDKLIQKIYQMITDKTKLLMRNLFDEAGKKLRNNMHDF